MSAMEMAMPSVENDLLPVTVVASEMVKPSTPPPYPIPLLRSSKLDQVIANVYMKTVHFYAHSLPCAAASSSSSSFFDVDVLKQALSQVLSVYYPIAGTITPALDIVCNGRGALFVEAVADFPLFDLGDLAPHPRLLKLVPVIDLSLDVTLRPLLLVQITRFECGGVAMGVAIEHRVADGVSALGFLKAWSRIARGESLTRFPSFDRAWLRATSSPPRKPRFTHDEYLNLPKTTAEKQRSGGDARVEADAEMERTVVGMFELSKELLQRMRAEGGPELTMYELLAAHVWRCCCDARELKDDDESTLVMVIDGRPRLSNGGGGGGDGGDTGSYENYVGNVVFNCCPRLRVSEIRRRSLRELGTAVGAALRRVDGEYCRSAIDFLEGCSADELRSFVKGAHTFRSPNVALISWSKLHFYEVDFGWGSAFHVAPADMRWEGNAYILPFPPASSPSSTPSPPGGGGRSLRLCIALPRCHIPAFSRRLLSP